MYQHIKSDSILQQITEEKKHNFNNYQTPEEENYTLQNVVYSKLCTFIFIMLSLKFSKKIVKEMINELCITYQLKELHSTLIITLIEEYNESIGEILKSDLNENIVSGTNDDLIQKNVKFEL